MGYEDVFGSCGCGAALTDVGWIEAHGGGWHDGEGIWKLLSCEI